MSGPDPRDAPHKTNTPSEIARTRRGRGGTQAQAHLDRVLALVRQRHLQSELPSLAPRPPIPWHHIPFLLRSGSFPPRGQRQGSKGATWPLRELLIPITNARRSCASRPGSPPSPTIASRSGTAAIGSGVGRGGARGQPRRIRLLALVELPGGRPPYAPRAGGGRSRTITSSPLSRTPEAHAENPRVATLPDGNTRDDGGHHERASPREGSRSDGERSPDETGPKGAPAQDDRDTWGRGRRRAETSSGVKGDGGPDRQRRLSIRV